MTLRFLVEEVFNVQGRVGPIVIGRVEEGTIEAGSALMDHASGRSVKVIGLEFESPKSRREGLIGLVLDSSQADFVKKGMLLEGH